MKPEAAFRSQAAACADLGSPLYADLLTRLADELGSRGADSPLATVLAGHEDDPADDMLALRLLGSVHRLVLVRRAGNLAAYYPSVGGTWEPVAGVAAFLDLLRRAPDAVRAWLDRPPQTNEVGRAAALVGGLLRLEPRHRLPVRLFEIGSSAGLNLLADRFAFADDEGRWWGDPGSPVRLPGAWSGPAPMPWPDLSIVAREGSDVRPIDVSTAEGRLALMAYVWPDQVARMERLRGAMSLAQADPPRVVTLDAVAFVSGIGLQPATTTVLWHSVMWQYLRAAEQAALAEQVARLGSQATPDAPFVHLLLEPESHALGEEREFLVVAWAWPGAGRRVLGAAAPHGVPVVWGFPWSGGPTR